MSYYNYILKAIKIDPSEIEKYNQEYLDDYDIFFENCKDFDKLKSVVGISCSDANGEVIVLKKVREGFIMIRPRDLVFPKNTFYGEAGCFISLNEIEKNINPNVSQDKEIKEAVKEYLKYVSPKYNFILMAY